jgi:hypothetical protein
MNITKNLFTKKKQKNKTTKIKPKVPIPNQKYLRISN